MSPSQILHQMLRELAQQLTASDAQLVDLKAEVERCNHGRAVAQERLDAALKQEFDAKRDYKNWLDYLNILPDRGSASMREKLTELNAVTDHTRIEADDLREQVHNWTRRWELARGAVEIAQQKHKALQNEHARLAEEVTKA